MADSKPMPVRTVHVELKDAYEGFWVDVQSNCAYSVKMEFRSQDTDRIWTAFAPLVRAWNLADEQGEALALPTTWERLQVEVPDELLGQLFDGFNDMLTEAAQLPKA